VYISFDYNFIIISLHELVQKFLFYNATLSSLVEHLFIAVKTDRLTKHSTVDCCCLVNQTCYTAVLENAICLAVTVLVLVNHSG